MTYTLENYLAKLHKGQWFGWTDSKNKIYANLVIHDNTESVCVTIIPKERILKLYQSSRNTIDFQKRFVNFLLAPVLQHNCINVMRPHTQKLLGQRGDNLCNMVSVLRILQ